jgi:NitT/TauT family transport system permease protein
LALWYIAAAIIPPTVMPPPHAVALALFVDMMSGTIWGDVLITLTRIGLAFCLAMSISMVVGFLMAFSHVAEKFFGIWVVAAMTIPNLVLILTIYMIAGLNEQAAVLATAIPIIPILTINISSAIKSIDQKLIDMSKAYHAKPTRIIASVVAPQIAPTLMSSARFGLGLIWKMVLFVELLGRSNGIGYRIDFYYQMFNMTEVLAHALLFVVIMLLLDTVVLGGIERRVFSWRPAHSHL